VTSAICTASMYDNAAAARDITDYSAHCHGPFIFKIHNKNAVGSKMISEIQEAWSLSMLLQCSCHAD